ncbi:hypothetical protein OSTOST_17433 [Ostertagia ostertagi]
MISIAQILVYSIVIFCSILAESSCPPRWKHDPKGKMCYYVSRLKMTHHDAHLYCQKFEIDRIFAESRKLYYARARFDIIDGAQDFLSGPKLFVSREISGHVDFKVTGWGMA